MILGLPRYFSDNLPANTEGVGLIPGLGRSPREGNCYPFQHSCLGNIMNSGAWWAEVHWSQKVRHNLATEQQ